MASVSACTLLRCGCCSVRPRLTFLRAVIGPMDLSMDIGDEAATAEAMERVHALARTYKMPLVGFAFEADVAKRFRDGYRMLMSAVDMWVLTSGIEKGMTAVRDIVEGARKEVVGNGKVDLEAGNGRNGVA